MSRHPGWSGRRCRRGWKRSGKLWSLTEMERTGGEPDVVGRDQKTGEFIFRIVPGNPAGRRNICYDRAALESRRMSQPTWRWIWRRSMGTEI